MKNFILGLFVLFFSTGLFSQNNLVLVGNTSSPNSCDGWAYVDTSLVSDVGVWNYIVQDSTVFIQNGSYFIDGLCPGSYNVEVFINGTVSIVTFEVISGNDTLCDGFNAYLANSQNTSNNVTCDGSAFVQVENGTGPYSFYLSNNSSTNGEFTNLCSGMNYVYVIDANGCSDELEFYIGFNDSVANPCDGFNAEATNITATTGANNCDGSTIININGGQAPYLLTLNNGTTTTNTNLTNLCSGWNWVSVTDANNCFTSIEFYIPGEDSTNNDCNSFYVGVETTNTSGINECDGGVAFIPSGGTAPYYLMINGTLSNLENISNLCAGSYTNTVTDANGCTFNVSYYIGESDTSNISQIYVYAYTNSVSSEGVCDGSVYFDIYGGAAPYTIVDENNVTLEQNQTGLCEGIYTAFISDANGNSYTVTYFIASPEDIIDNGGYNDSTVIDTLYSGTVEDCIIDYLTLDSAYISNIELIGLDSIVVTWNIITANGITEIIEGYDISGWGVYELILQVFCPQRSTSPYFIVKQKAMIGYSGIEEKLASIYNVYPNPVVDNLHITLEEQEATNVQIIDMNGRVLYQTNVNSAEIIIPFNNYSNGNYILRLQNSKGINYEKLIK